MLFVEIILMALATALREGVSGQGVGSSDDVFEFGPGLFDGVELGRVRRGE